MAAPIVPLALVIFGTATAVGGVTAATVGGLQIRASQTRIRQQAARYEVVHAEHLASVEATNERLRDLGRQQSRAQTMIVQRMRDFLLRHEKQVRAHEHLVLDGVGGATIPVAALSKLHPDVAGWMSGIIGAATIGVGAPAALSTTVRQFASASTGTPISALNGAAAEKAGMAFLGGGSLKSGGGGIKLGKTASGVAAAGPAVLIAGIAVKNQGTQAKTAADQHRAEVEVGIAELEARNELLRGVREHADRLGELLVRMSNRAHRALDLLESDPFDMSVHAERFHTALSLTAAVRDIAITPVADEEGKLDTGSENLLFIYRETTKESRDD